MWALRQSASSARKKLTCAYARAGCAAAHRCHSQPFGTRRASPTFASQTFWHAAFHLRRATTTHVGMSPVCRALGLGVLPPTGATANLLVRGAHRQRLHLKRSGTRRSAAFHVGRTPDCLALGRGVREISVAAGTGPDVTAGGAGADKT